MTESVDVRPVQGRREMRQFVDYLYERNAYDPHWVPPLRISEFERLDPKKNPFFAHADVELLLARRGTRVVGRIAAIDDRLHRETHGDNLAMFGFFEAEDSGVATALLTAVERWASARGRAAVRGPISPSLNEMCGLLVDGFDTDPMLLMPHNPPEYGAQIEAAGYAKIKDLYAWLQDLRTPVPLAFVRGARWLRAAHRITIRPLNLREFTREVEQLRALYCAAWERNWGFVAPTAAEFRRIAAELKPIFDPRCTVCAEVDGKMIACVVAVPDINQALKGTNGRLFPLGLIRLLLRKRYISQVRLLLLGIDERHRGLGLFPLLLAEWHRQMQETPYARAEFSWVLEDNRDINHPAEAAGATRYKTYRIYEKAL
jgi:GNAT superfamily N-acetyltransferase